MEMECIECLLDIYRTYILGTVETVAAESSNNNVINNLQNANNSTNMYAWATTAHTNNRSLTSTATNTENKLHTILQVTSHATPQQPLCDFPREVTKFCLSCNVWHIVMTQFNNFSFPYRN